MMRILYLLTQDLESPAGIGRLLPLGRELAHLGHTVQVAALHSNFDSVESKHFSTDGINVNYVAQMHVLKTGNHKEYFSTASLLRHAAVATWELSRAARVFPADIIHIFKPHPMNTLAGLIGRAGRKAKLFLDIDDLEAASHFTGKWQKWGVQFFENQAPHWVDGLTTHNSFLEKRLTDRGIPPAKITYLPNGVDIHRFGTPDENLITQYKKKFGLVGKKVVGFIGSLSLVSHPINLLIEAFVIVHQHSPEARLLIVGGGENYKDLKSMVEELGLSEAVLFTGRVSPDQVGVFYRLAQIIVDPVYDNLSAQTRLPLKLFESWVNGVPFITGDSGDRRRVLGDPPAGVLVPAGDPTALAAGILKVLQDPNLAQTLTQMGLDRVPQYDWRKLARNIESIYLQALKSGGVHPE
jgi:glycosyltransferase involved in cell wall biosynthesis